MIVKISSSILDCSGHLNIGYRYGHIVHIGAKQVYIRFPNGLACPILTDPEIHYVKTVMKVAPELFTSIVTPSCIEILWND